MPMLLLVSDWVKHQGFPSGFVGCFFFLNPGQKLFIFSNPSGLRNSLNSYVLELRAATH